MDYSKPLGESGGTCPDGVRTPGDVCISGLRPADRRPVVGERVDGRYWVRPVNRSTT